MESMSMIDILIPIVVVILDLIFINWSLYKFDSGIPALIVNVVLLLLLILTI